MWNNVMNGCWCAKCYITFFVFNSGVNEAVQGLWDFSIWYVNISNITNLTLSLGTKSGMPMYLPQLLMCIQGYVYTASRSVQFRFIAQKCSGVEAGHDLRTNYNEGEEAKESQILIMFTTRVMFSCGTVRPSLLTCYQTDRLRYVPFEFCLHRSITPNNWGLTPSLHWTPSSQLSSHLSFTISPASTKSFGAMFTCSVNVA